MGHQVARDTEPWWEGSFIDAQAGYWGDEDKVAFGGHGGELP